MAPARVPRKGPRDTGPQSSLSPAPATKNTMAATTTPQQSAARLMWWAFMKFAKGSGTRAFFRGKRVSNTTVGLKKGKYHSPLGWVHQGFAGLRPPRRLGLN